MADISIRGLINLVLEGKGAVDATKQLKETERAAKETGEALERTGGTLRRFAGWLAAAFSVNVLASFVREFAKIERGFNGIAASIRSIGGDVAKELPRVKEFLLALGPEKLGDTIPAYQKFVGILKDTNAAMLATKIATGAAESGLADMGRATEGVAALLQGRALGAAQAFGLELRKTNGELKTNAELFEELRAKVEAFGAAGKDTAEQFDTLEGSLTRLRLEVGEALAPAVGTLATALFHVIGAAKDLGTVWGVVIDQMVTQTQNFGSLIGEAFNLKRAIKSPADYAAAVSEAYQRITRDGLLAFETLKEGVAANHTQAAAAVTDEAAGVKKILEVANRARLEETKKTNAETKKETKDALADYEKEYLRFYERLDALARDHENETAELELRTQRERAQARLAAAREQGDAEAELEAALLDEQLALFEDNLDKHAEIAKQAIRRETDARVEAEQGVIAAAELALQQEQITADQKVAIVKTAETRIEALRRRGATAEMVLARETARAKKELALQGVGDIAGALASVFEDQKGFAIAAATIDALAGANKALNDPTPMPFWVRIAAAAAVLARGYANVRAIKSTSLGSGGGGGDISAGSGAIAAGGPPPPVASGPPSQPPPTETFVTNNTSNATTVQVVAPQMNRVAARRMARVLSRARDTDPKRRW